MSVQEIEIAITKLNSEEFWKLSGWILESRSQQWDEQIEEDAKAGRLNALIKKAKEQNRQGLTQPL